MYDETNNPPIVSELMVRGKEEGEAEKWNGEDEKKMKEVEKQKEGRPESEGDRRRRRNGQRVGSVCLSASVAWER